jgi:hypothetical protein
MLMKVGGLARALYIILALVAGFVALGTMDVTLALVVLGLIAGVSLPDDRMVLAAVAIIALPIVGTALTHIPAIGAQLNAVTLNLQMAMAASVATAMAMRLYRLALDGIMGLAGGGAGGATAAAAR